MNNVTLIPGFKFFTYERTLDNFFFSIEINDPHSLPPCLDTASTCPPVWYPVLKKKDRHLGNFLKIKIVPTCN
jgi:hypothetical protein